MIVDTFIEYYNKDNNKWFELTKTPIYEENELIGYIGSLTDISRIKFAKEEAKEHAEKAEQAAQEAIDVNHQNILLLKEVHHRVKNNLQLITSFINLEKRFQSDSDEIIDITKKRIDALAAIHERIYAEENMKNIHMKSFSADFIKNLYALSNHTGINFITDTSDDILFSIDIITPIILIYNELVTNSLKHAFDKDFNGIKEIHSKLEFKTIDSKLYCQFTYRDTGKGLPEGFDINKVNSLGMIIIKELSGQLDDEFEFFNDNGFNFKLTFPLKEDLTGYI